MKMGKSKKLLNKKVLKKIGRFCEITKRKLKKNKKKGLN